MNVCGPPTVDGLPPVLGCEGDELPHVLVNLVVGGPATQELIRLEDSRFPHIHVLDRGGPAEGWGSLPLPNVLGLPAMGSDWLPYAMCFPPSHQSGWLEAGASFGGDTRPLPGLDARAVATRRRYYSGL
jgi:hypothetical protein